MQRLILVVITSFALAMALGPIIIPWLKRMKFGQTINELGPESHKKKQGVPTMGGLIFAIPIIIVPLIFSFSGMRFSMLWVAILGTAGFGLIGFVDDLIIIKKRRSVGLTPRQKMIPQFVVAIAVSVWAYMNPDIGSSLRLPFTQNEWNLGWAFIPLMSLLLVFTVNSSNIMDGVDGLLAGCSMIDFATTALIVMAFAVGLKGDLQNDYLDIMLFSGACAGALLGYLRYNSHPASVIMGDVGSFVVGGALSMICLTTRLSLILPIIALAMYISSGSVILQVAYFKKTKGKRILKMSPLHHHLELSGMPETRIVSTYMIGTAALCLLTLLWVAV